MATHESRAPLRFESLDDAVGALSVKLSAEDIAFLEEPYVPHPIAGH